MWIAAALRRFAPMLLVFVSGGVLPFAQAKEPAPKWAKPTGLPSALAVDTYAIYSQLLPGNQIEWGDAERDFWLLEETTTALPLQEGCATSGDMNPHQSVRPTGQERASFAEVLADYDRRCHERYRLEASRFQLQLPVRLLDEAGQRRYVKAVGGYLPPPGASIMQAPPTPHEFKGAAGMHHFTAVYFNKAHTLAMTEIAMYCGGTCGHWKWVVLHRTSDGWTVLPWVSMDAMS